MAKNLEILGKNPEIWKFYKGGPYENPKISKFFKFFCSTPNGPKWPKMMFFGHFGPFLSQDSGGGQKSGFEKIKQTLLF